MKTTISRRWPAPLTIPILCLLAFLALAQFPMLASCQIPSTFTTLPCEKSICHFKPKSVAVDSAGHVYFADAVNHVICRMLPSGHVMIVAGKLGACGSADGAYSQARFCNPRGIAIDASDDIIVADSGNNTIRHITPDGVVTTVAGLAEAVGSRDGTGIYARFNYPTSVAVDRSDNIYVADLYNSTIRKVTRRGTVTTIAGEPGIAGSADGKRYAALFNVPISIALDNSGNLYVADTMNNAIRKITTDGMVTTFAGRLSYTTGKADGLGSSARFCHPCGVAVDNAGNVYVADSGNNTIRCITPDHVVITLARLPGQSGFTDGMGSAARFWHPTALALDCLGNLFVTDLDNTVIRKGSAAISSNAAFSFTAAPKTFDHK